MTTEIEQKTIGRPSKLTPEMTTALSEVIAKGNYYVTACQLCGIDESTLWLWLKQAQEDASNGLETGFTRLFKSLKEAEARAETRLVEVVREAAEVKREWLPAITFLERRHPDRWGRRDRTRIDINETKTITITHVEYSLAPGIPGEIIEGESRELLEGGK